MTQKEWPKMDPELKALWLADLRSGAFSQGYRRLLDGEGYCCLGVLAQRLGYQRRALLENSDLEQLGCEVLGPWGKQLSDGRFSSVDPDTWTTVQRMLAGMNDSGKTFLEISDWIEESL